MNLEGQQFLDGSRKLIEISGTDANKFLQGILTNDINVAVGSIIYAGILTPQGKYLFDFFVWGINERTFFLDIEKERVEELKNTLNRYRLRSDIVVSDVERKVLLGFGKQPFSSFPDPRNARLGWRKLVGLDFEVASAETVKSFAIEYEKRRVELSIPKYGHELLPNKSYILEVGFDWLNGLSFSKGCFVGQEVTARMKHKATLKNGLIRFRNAPEYSSEEKKIVNEKGQTVGVLSSSVNGMGLGLVKFSFLNGKLICDGNELELLEEVNYSTRT